MANFIPKPTIIEAAGQPPKSIEEFIGRVNGTGPMAIPVPAIRPKRQPFPVEVAVLLEIVRQPFRKCQAWSPLGPGQGLGGSGPAADCFGYIVSQQCHGRHLPGV